MALRTPILDDRSYAQLRDELVARIPVYAPEWTDHHPSDPGVTLLELFAFLGENLLFRFNQIPDATRLAFLDLLDIPLLPAEPATGIVEATTRLFTGPLLPLGAPLFAGKTPFSTLDEVSVWPVQALAAMRERATMPTDEETLEHLGRASAAIGESIEDVVTYRTVFGAADPSKPGGDVLDVSTMSLDGIVWIAIAAEEEAGVAAARDALAGGRLSIGVVPAEDVADTAIPNAAATPCPGGATAPPTPSVEWQLSTVLAETAGDPELPDPVWLRLAVEADTSAGLTRTGVVAVRFPDDVSDVGVFVPDDLDALGAGDQPPLVEDDDLATRIVAWIRAFRPDGTAIGALEWVGANATRVEQSVRGGPEFLGTGTGHPDQEYRLVHPSVLGDDLVLEVEESGALRRWVRWTIVDDFRASAIDDRHAMLDRGAGMVRFGDGLRGRVPQAGERIRVVSYRYGGGAAGNVAPMAISKAEVDGVKVANRLPVRGGADSETTAAAVERIPGELRRHDRAVTRTDFHELARSTPGAGIARAETLPLFHPANPDLEVPGAITVVVWPAEDLRHPDAPSPTRSQISAVCRYLDDRRLVTTELHVVPPTYRRIAVGVGIVVKPGYGTEGVRRWVEQLLRQYLAPLPPFGPEGGGWPLGRRVHGPELEAAALQVEGVEYLEGLRISVADGDDWEELEPPTLDLETYEVVQLAEVSVVAGTPPVPGGGIAAPAPAGPAVPVRAPREVC